MKKPLKTLFAVLPDGEVITRTTARAFQFVACYEDVEWHAEHWSLSRERARWHARRYARRHGAGIIDVAVIPVQLVAPHPLTPDEHATFAAQAVDERDQAWLDQLLDQLEQHGPPAAAAVGDRTTQVRLTLATAEQLRLLARHLGFYLQTGRGAGDGNIAALLEVLVARFNHDPERVVHGLATLLRDPSATQQEETR